MGRGRREEGEVRGGEEDDSVLMRGVNGGDGYGFTWGNVTSKLKSSCMLIQQGRTKELNNNSHGGMGNSGSIYSSDNTGGGDAVAGGGGTLAGTGGAVLQLNGYNRKMKVDPKTQVVAHRRIRTSTAQGGTGILRSPQKKNRHGRGANTKTPPGELTMGESTQKMWIGIRCPPITGRPAARAQGRGNRRKKSPRQSVGGAWNQGPSVTEEKEGRAGDSSSLNLEGQKKRNCLGALLARSQPKTRCESKAIIE